MARVEVDDAEVGVREVSDTYPELKQSPVAVFRSAAEVRARIGDDIGVSEWHVIAESQTILGATNGGYARGESAPWMARSSAWQGFMAAAC